MVSPRAGPGPSATAPVAGQPADEAAAVAPGEADAAGVDGGDVFDPERRYQLHPDVALRPEPFGALAYHYGSRRLTFLRSPLLTEVVRSLGTHESVEAALVASVPDAQHPAFRRALASLAKSRFICVA